MSVGQDERITAAAKANWRRGFVYPSTLWSDLEPSIQEVHRERARAVLNAADEVEAREVAALTAECEQLRAALRDLVNRLREIVNGIPPTSHHGCDAWVLKRAKPLLKSALAVVSESVPAAQEEPK